MAIETTESRAFNPNELLPIVPIPRTSPGTYPVPPEPTIKEEIVAATATPFDIVMSATASFPAAVTFVRGT